ncbi:hypothetical protein SAMN04490239_1678 [Rhodococcus koreensis]|uniref:AAA-like domain-containing protein n=1 Tax=Rhodococcus koreensis TaxID=99653 RepID=A0A1H4M8E2_9NOCA|nr:hypothetical protein SAMN04490239_1678 [Rhodococcus koreensis]
MTTDDNDNDIASLFDPQLEDPVPVIPPGALPPSWAAGRQRPAPQPGPRAWSEVELPPHPVTEAPEVDARASDPTTLAEDTRTRERQRKTSQRRGKSPADRENAAAIDYLLRRSATIGLPLAAGGAVAGGGDWEEGDVAALEDLTDLSLTPGDGYTTVSGVVDGRRYTGAVIILTVGRMAPLPIPERMLPWQVIGDPSGEPLEWSDRIELHDKAKTIRTMRSLTGRIEHQFDHYTVEHDQVPPKELAEQHARVQDVISDVEEDHSGLSTRTSGWYRVAVVGTTPDEARKKVAGLRKMYKPHIALEHEHGQFLLLREFIPGQPLASKRHMDVEAVAAGMATAGDRIGDRRGVVLGETSSIAPRPVIWDLFAAHEIKHKSGLTLIVAVPGSGKTFLAGMIVYQAVRAGAYGVVLDPSGPLKEPANLPEFRDIARVYALTGRDSRPGAARLRGCAANQYSVDSVVTVGRTCGCGDYRRR